MLNAFPLKKKKKIANREAEAGVLRRELQRLGSAGKGRVVSLGAERWFSPTAGAGADVGKPSLQQVRFSNDTAGASVRFCDGCHQ